MAQMHKPSNFTSLAAVRPHGNRQPVHPSEHADVSRRAWPAHFGAGLTAITVPGRAAVWVRHDVLDYALIALGPQRIEAIISALPLTAADDQTVRLANGARITDRTGAFTRMADWLFPVAQPTHKPVKTGVATVRGLRHKLEQDPAYDLSDMDVDGLLVTYQRYCRQPQHPITLACMRELARRQIGLAC